MPDAPTPLDLDAIRASRSSVGYLGNDLADNIDAVIAEVERLRAEVARLTARPAPAWDEEAAIETFKEAWHKADAEGRAGERVRDGLVAVVREHLPVKPDREAVARALAEHRLMGGRCRCGLDPRLDYYRYEQHVTDAVLDLLPGRLGAEVAAEALREFARGINLEEVGNEWEGNDPALASDLHWAASNAASAVQMRLYARADRLAAEGGDDRG